MRRGSATVVCVAGDDALVLAAAKRLSSAANVARAEGRPNPPETPAGIAVFEREVRRIYGRASSAQAPYVLCETDPLAPARDAWRRRFDAGPDVLPEFAGATSRALELPDYYFLLHTPSPGDDPDLELEWYAGLVRGLRPSRVVVVPADADLDVVSARASHALATLPTGPWWPSIGEVLDAAQRFVPRSVVPPVPTSHTGPPAGV